jgi:hypothetical protein
MKISEILKTNQIERTKPNAFVFLPGPSLMRMDKKKIELISDYCDIIAVKQAYKLSREKTKFHIINQNNLVKYNYNKSNVTKVLAIMATGVKNKIYSMVHLEIPQSVDFKNLNSRLGINLNLENYTLSETEKLPWGPGIMNDFVFYFLEYLGYKNIFFNGFDYSSPNQKITEYSHNYDKHTTRIISRFTSKLRNNYFRYILGLLYNKAGKMPEDENLIAIELSDSFYDFFSTRGVELYLVDSSNSFVSQKYSRITFNEFLEKMENEKYFTEK